MRTTKLIVTAMLAAAMCSGQSWGATLQSAGTGGMWTNPATWTPAQVPASADDVTITNGCTVTMNDLVTRSVSNLTIQAGGVLTHTAHGNYSASDYYKVILSVVSNLTVEAGGQINVDSKGRGGGGANAGPGNSGDWGGGAGYGGQYGRGGPTYGSITNPTDCGSGAWDPKFGGGAVILTVGGTTAIDGLVSANGGGSDRAGSGGSVFLTTGSLSGSGTLRANGGAATEGGGGGRVAVILKGSTDFGSVTMQAYGGSATYPGAAGTVYMEHTGHVAGRGRLIVDNGPLASLYTTIQNSLAASSHTFSEIILTNGAVYELDANDSLDISAAVVQGSPANRNEGFYVSGTLTVPSTFGFTNYFIAIGNASATFSPTALTVGTNATFRINATWTMNTPVVEPGAELLFDKPVVLNGSLSIPVGASLTHTAHGNWSVADYYKIDATIVGDLTIPSGVQANVDAKGRGGNSEANGGPGWAGSWGAGGSHGGLYGDFSGGGATYGSITAPTNCGSGGFDRWGGGAVRLNVTGLTALNGIISANGTAGENTGSGGSVFLTTGTLSGSGTIRANGGAATLYCGGGGRVAVIVTNSITPGDVTMQAYTGTGPRYGSCGTVYVETSAHSAGCGTLTVNGGGRTPYSASVTTLIGPLVTGTTVGTVIVTNQAVLVITNRTLTVNGSLENTATFNGMLNSTVVFQGTNAARILSGSSNTFYNLVCTNIGETLSFQDARTNTVNGVLTLANITLNSISGGQWYLKASPSTHNVTNVNVSWSDARPGSAIEAFDSVNGGNNYNWVFAESGFRTNYWTGAVNSDWTDTNNWSRGRSTQLSDTVVVTNGSPNYPQLQAETRILSLVVSNGAWMGLSSYNLVVDDDVRVAGALAAAGTEKLTLRGDVDFSGGGVFTAANSTVWIAGSNAQTVVSGGISFRNLSISNSAASVMFTDAVSATNIVNYATPVTFGGAVTVQNLLRTVGTNVIFGGAVNVPLLYNETGALVFSGTVTTVAFTNQGANLTFRDQLASDRFYCAPGGLLLTFEAGKTNTIGALELYGNGGNRIRLRSSAAAQWGLKVTGTQTVRLVDVEYSDASSGLTIYPLGSTNGGNNANWDFGESWQTWVGGVSGSFTNGSNWDPAGAPDGAGTHLLVCDYTGSAPVLSNSLSATVGRLTVGGGVSNSILTLDGLLTVTGDMDVVSGGRVTHTAHGNYTTFELYKLNATILGDLTIEAGGQINVDAKGGGGGSETTGGPGFAGSWGAGGSHGGLYGDFSGGGATYGSITAPTNCGSGGWDARCGGGAVRLNVTGLTTLDGLISASGSPVAVENSGSGGSVFLTTGTLSGSGTIRANSGATTLYSGGGGRVAVIVTNGVTLDNVKMEAYAASGRNGACGTVYTETSAQGAGRGMLTVNGGGRTPYSAAVTTLIGPLVSGTTVGTVIITNQAVLVITNRTLTVNGDWVNGATFAAQTNSTVDFAGASAATIYANNTFFNLTCTNAGKTLSFEAGRTNTVTGLLRLGASQPGQTVTLQSTTNGSWSYLTLVPGGTQAIARVNVKDNNAGGGQTLLAGVGSANRGNNINWQFPPSGTMFMVK